MILGFKQKINGKPTYFPEKIWKSLTNVIPSYYAVLDEYECDFKNKFDLDVYPNFIDNEHAPKLHTIRGGNRWKPGMDIHFAINTRTKNYFRFAPVVKCTSVQEIEIIHLTNTIVKLDGACLANYQIEELAINDGFDSVEDFFAYFDKDFKGQVIHWTDLKY